MHLDVYTRVTEIFTIKNVHCFFLKFNFPIQDLVQSLENIGFNIIGALVQN